MGAAPEGVWRVSHHVTWQKFVQLIHHSHSPKLVPQFTTVFHQLLHAYLPDSFPALLKSFLQASLNRVAATSPDPKRPSKGISPSPHLSRLGIIPRYSATLSQVAYEEIERIAKEEAAEGWDVRRLATARQKVGERVATWLSGIFEGEPGSQSFAPWKGSEYLASDGGEHRQ